MIFPRVRIRRLQCEIYFKQSSTAHGRFGDYQARLFSMNPTRFYGEEYDRTLPINVRALRRYTSQAERYFPRDYNDSNAPRSVSISILLEGVRVIVKKNLLLTVHRNFGLRRDGRVTRGLRDPGPRSSTIQTSCGACRAE